ncbi:hypothetical protein CRG98_036801 [Punica granatum]|uniref:40S ribosomal protein S27 n=1 Tax=Punica granatum TaxID=22663 RepID=A0A2I0IFR6_PUNGR|nr:hypothetical protein CRG98_036801 [Punica granatum]
MTNFGVQNENSPRMNLCFALDKRTPAPFTDSFSALLSLTVRGFVRPRDFTGASRRSEMVLQNDVDLLNPPAELEKRKHKLKRLVQTPNSFFMTVVVCGNCQTVLCQPTGGRARLTEGSSFRRKGD